MSFLSLVPIHELRSRFLMTEGGRSGKRVALFKSNINSPIFRHREVMALFGELEEVDPRKSGSILFRTEIGFETETGKQVPSYLVRSAVEPKYPTPGTQTRVEDFTSLKVGSPVKFCISANAVTRQGNKAFPTAVMGSKPTDTATLTADDWLRRRLTGVLTEIEVVNHQRELLRDDRRKPHVIQVDRFDGAGIIENVELLKKVLENGLGRAKSYGCGLLTVKTFQ